MTIARRWELPLLVLIAGCTAVEERPGFASVHAQVRERTGGDAVWNRGDPDATRASSEFAPLQGELDIADAVQAALLFNPSIQAVFEELGISQAAVVAASRLHNPTLDIELRFLESGGGEILEFVLVQNIVGLVLMPLRKRVAAERFEQAKARVTAAALDLAGEVRMTYRRLQAQRQLCEMLQRTVDATFYSQDAAQRLRQAGNIPEVDMLREQALYERARADLAAAQTMALRLRTRMNVLLGLWDERSTAWQVPHRLPDPDPALDADGIVRTALDRSLDLEVGRREILAIGHRLRLRKIEAVMPELGVAVAGEREPDGKLSLGPGLSVPIPIFDQGQAASARGRAELRQAYQRFTATAVRLRARVEDAYVAMDAARRRARFFREQVLPVRMRITAATQRRANAMQTGIFELLQAKRMEIDAGRRYVETLRAYWLARTELELILAGRIPRTRFGLAAAVGPDTGGDAGAAGGQQGGH